MSQSLYVIVGRRKFYVPIEEVAYLESGSIHTLDGKCYPMNHHWGIRHWLGLLLEPEWIRINATQLVKSSAMHSLESERKGRGWVMIEGCPGSFRVTEPNWGRVRRLMNN